MADPPPSPDDFLGSGLSPGADRRTIQRARRKQVKRGRRRWPRRLLVTVVVVALLAAAGSIGTYVYAGYRFGQIKKVDAKHLIAQGAPGKPFNILLVGSDSRKFVGKTAKQTTEFGTPTTQGGQRSDVTMVARFIPATKQVWILSIPRDLWVDIPGDVPGISGTNRINAAFNTGPDLLIQTIEKDLGIPVNHYVSVTFEGFQDMVNALGGVTMDFPDPVKDQYSGLDVTQTGCQMVDGATALELVRARHLYYEVTTEWEYDGLSDFSRIQRQDAFFRALLQKLNTEKFDPLTINSFIGAAVKDLTIDSTLTEGDLFSMAEDFHGLSEANLHTETLPTYGWTTTGGAEVLSQAQPYAKDMVAAFNRLGTTAPTGASAGSSRPHATTTTTAPPLPPAQVDVDVLNGVDFAEPIATETSAQLRQDGFVISGVANATSDGVTTTEIEYAEGHRPAGQSVAAHVSGTTVLAADPQLHGNQVVLIVGSSFDGVTGTTEVTGATGVSATGATGTGAGTGTGTTGTGAGTGGAPTTTTTVPPADVHTNTQPEPWNPTPCTL